MKLTRSNKTSFDYNFFYKSYILSFGISFFLGFILNYFSFIFFFSKTKLSDLRQFLVFLLPSLLAFRANIFGSFFSYIFSKRAKAIKEKKSFDIFQFYNKFYIVLLKLLAFSIFFYFVCFYKFGLDVFTFFDIIFLELTPSFLSFFLILGSFLFFSNFFKNVFFETIFGFLITNLCDLINFPFFFYFEYFRFGFFYYSIVIVFFFLLFLFVLFPFFFTLKLEDFFLFLKLMVFNLICLTFNLFQGSFLVDYENTFVKFGLLSLTNFFNSFIITIVSYYTTIREIKEKLDAFNLILIFFLKYIFILFSFFFYSFFQYTYLYTEFWKLNFFILFCILTFLTLLVIYLLCFFFNYILYFFFENPDEFSIGLICSFSDFFCSFFFFYSFSLFF